MSDTKSETVQCPFCREDVRAGARKCKHCQSALPQQMPEHEGTCPFCLEDIKPGATKCHHCLSLLGASADCGCHGPGPGGSPGIAAARFQPALGGVDQVGGSPGFIGGRRCITLNVPICRWVEDVDPIAGYYNGRWECTWEPRTICTPDWW